MGLLSGLGNILFGKSADIFDEKGNVLHKHPKKKWDGWQNRFKNDGSYNWRQHDGVGPTAAVKPLDRDPKQS